MVLELGDSCVVRCRTSDLVCELDFKTKVNTHLTSVRGGDIILKQFVGAVRDSFQGSITRFQERLKRNQQAKCFTKYQVNGLVKSILKWPR